MRCKPGDLAVQVISDFPENVGVIVEVLGPGESYTGCGPHWECRSIGRAMRFDWYDAIGATGEGGGDLIVDIADSCLRPIRDQDGVDETLREKELVS